MTPRASGERRPGPSRPRRRQALQGRSPETTCPGRQVAGGRGGHRVKAAACADPVPGPPLRVPDARGVGGGAQTPPAQRAAPRPDAEPRAATASPAASLTPDPCCPPGRPQGGAPRARSLPRPPGASPPAGGSTAPRPAAGSGAWPWCTAGRPCGGKQTTSARRPSPPRTPEPPADAARRPQRGKPPAALGARLLQGGRPQRSVYCGTELENREAMNEGTLRISHFKKYCDQYYCLAFSL